MDRGKGNIPAMSQWSADDELVSLERTVPGQPLLQLEDQAALNQFLSRELSTLRLRRRYAILFVASKPDNVSSLHHQAFKGRKICITERVDLHLVWYYDRIFIKPIPQCLFSRTFREKFLPHAKDFDGDHLAPEADGFLKSYSMLIVHESDFDLAKELRLLPLWIDWVAWCHFIHEFQRLRAKHVSRRYHYGEIRLTRLNSFSCLLYGSSYEEMQHNYAIYFARFGAPYVFVFGAITVLLTALQTGLAAYVDGGMYRGIAIKFVPFTCVVTMAGLLLLPLLWLFFQLKELFLYNYRYREMS